MKKLVSVILSVLVVVAISISFAVPAMAEVDVYSPQGGAIVHAVNDPTLNGSSSNNVSGKSLGNGSNQFTFSYSGTGVVKGWQLIGKDGKAFPIDETDGTYKVIAKTDNSVTIEVLDWDAWQYPDGYTVNAIVDAAASGSTDKDTSSKSPSTGVSSLAFAAIAAAGAGSAALTLLKKKESE